LARFEKAVTGLIDKLIEQQSVDVVLMPRYPAGLWDDLKHLNDIRQRSQDKNHVFVYQGDDAPPADYLAMWRVFDLVISVALHDALFAIALNRPCVQLYYESKGRDLAEELGADNYMCHWSALSEAGGLERILGMAEYAMVHQVDQKTSERQEALKVRAALNVDYLQAMVRAKGFRI
jgi:polysaccharide pyruvyl transferase WcaK-like protein